MAQYGRQPDGMIRLINGQLWDPSTPLPPDSTDAFNSTPMGNPLVPSTQRVMPDAVAAASAPASPTPTAAPAPAGAPQGMFGAPPPTSMPVSSVAAPAVNVPKPTFFKPGGLGGKILNGIGGFADTWLATQGNPYGLAKMQEADEAHKAQILAQQEFAKQQAEFVRQYYLQQTKPQEAGSFQKNYEYLNGLNPKLSSQYAQQFAAGPPVVGTINGVTGLISRSSFAGAPDQKPTVDWAGAIAYLRKNPNFAPQFDEQFGQGAAQAVLGQ
jgi:hypothetical protein